MQMPDDIQMLEQNDLGYTVEFNVPPDLFYFNGHFPVKQLLPGVVQVGWVEELTRRYLDPQLALKAISQLKFTAPVMPGDRLQIQALLSADHHKLDFTYLLKLKGQLIQASKGRLVFVENA